MQYGSKEIYDKNYKCFPIDFGGDQISGHPIWFNDHLFGIIDRANRAIHVYKVKKDGDIFKTKLVQTIPTITSLHQIIPKDEGNNIFYGSCEGNGVKNLVSGVYKFKVVNDRLKVIKYTTLQNGNIYGTNGHNIYIFPKKDYLYIPVGATLTRVKEKDDDYFFFSKVNKINRLKRNYHKIIAMYGNFKEDTQNIDIFNYKKIKKIFKKNKKFSEYLPTIIPSFYDYLMRNYYQSMQYEFIPKGGVFIVDAKTMKVKKFIYTGVGAGHVAFSKQKSLAVVTNHLDRVISIINHKKMQFVTNIFLDFPKRGFTKLTQSHMQYISSDGKYYYNFWSDGGYFFRINLDELDVDSVIEVGGVPIQGNFYEKINTTCNLPKNDEDDGYERFFGNNDDEDIDLDLNGFRKNVKFKKYWKRGFFRKYKHYRDKD